MKAEKIWNGSTPATCNLCGCGLRVAFWDCRLAGRTAWAMLCPLCQLTHGTERGQKYERRRRKGGAVWVLAESDGVDLKRDFRGPRLYVVDGGGEWVKLTEARKYAQSIANKYGNALDIFKREPDGRERLAMTVNPVAELN